MNALDYCFMHRYKYRKQCLIVLACCVLHNLIKRQNEIETKSDIFLDQEQEATNDGEDDEDIEQSGITTGLNKTQLGDLL